MVYFSSSNMQVTLTFSSTLWQKKIAIVQIHKGETLTSVERGREGRRKCAMELHEPLGQPGAG